MLFKNIKVDLEFAENIMKITKKNVSLQMNL